MILWVVIILSNDSWKDKLVIEHKSTTTEIVCTCEICGKGTESVHHHICKECKTRLYKMLYYYDDPQLIKNRLYG